MSNQKVAILFFGLTKNVDKSYPSIKKNILDRLTKSNYDYDVFVHTYILDTYNNLWSNEYTKNYNNEEYKKLKPAHVLLDNQTEIINKLNVQQYYSLKNLGNWAGVSKSVQMTKQMIRNMALALYSKKRIIEYFATMRHEYKYVIILRPDQCIDSQLNTNCFKLLKHNNIVIPNQHNYNGLNDRMCICKPNVAIMYGRAFKHLLKYSRRFQIVSEVFWKYFLIIGCRLIIIYSSLKSHLVRIN